MYIYKERERGGGEDRVTRVCAHIYLPRQQYIKSIQQRAPHLPCPSSFNLYDPVAPPSTSAHDIYAKICPSHEMHMATSCCAQMRVY